MIIISDLSYKYRNRADLALKRVSLKIEKGENVVLIGSSGSGKSTLIRCINRLLEPISGSISVNGKDILNCNRKETEKIRRAIGVVFQGFNLIERESVLRNVLNGRLGYVGVLQAMFNKFGKEDYEIGKDSLHRVGLYDLKDERVSNLSGGQKQRVAIARALSQGPEIILADEPVSSLDPKLMKEIMDLLQEVCIEKGITLISSLHFLELVKKYASRVVGIKSGNIIFDGSIDDLTDKDLITIYGETRDWRLYGKLGF